MPLKRTAGVLLVVVALLAEATHADQSMLLDAVLGGTSQQHSKASMMGARGGHKEAAIVGFQTASWNDCLWYLGSSTSPVAETQLTCNNGWEPTLSVLQSPAVKCTWIFGAFFKPETDMGTGGSSPGNTTAVPDAITRVGNAQGICTVQHAAEDCLAVQHGEVPLCAGMTMSINAGVFFVPALLKDSNYTMPIGALSSGSSSTGVDDSCCSLAPPLEGSGSLFPPYIQDLDVCKDYNSERRNKPTGIPAVNSKGSKTSKSSGSSSTAAKGPSAPAPAAKGKAGSAASTERYHGSRDTEDEGYYEGIAMVVSGPMYIANWDTEEQWEVTGMMDWVPWANAIGDKQTGTPPEKLIHVNPGLNRFKFFKEAPARYYSTTGPTDTTA